jgi:hypothetical protein
VADTTAPKMGITPDAGTYNTPFSFGWNIADPQVVVTPSGVNATTCEVKVNGIKVSDACAGNYQLGVGISAVSVTATDNNGNIGTENREYTINQPVATGTLVINKKSGATNGLFNFNLIGPMALKPNITTVNGIGTTGALKLAVGQYSLSEIVPAGWSLNGLSCSVICSGSCSSSISQRNFAVSFKMAKGMKITCTFTNKKK